MGALGLHGPCWGAPTCCGARLFSVPWGARRRIEDVVLALLDVRACCELHVGRVLYGTLFSPHNSSLMGAVGPIFSFIPILQMRKQPQRGQEQSQGFSLQLLP